MEEEPCVRMQVPRQTEEASRRMSHCWVDLMHLDGCIGLLIVQDAGCVVVDMSHLKSSCVSSFLISNRRHSLETRGCPAEVSKDVEERTDELSLDDEKRRNYGGVYVGLPADLSTVTSSQSKSTHKGESNAPSPPSSTFTLPTPTSPRSRSSDPVSSELMLCRQSRNRPHHCCKHLLTGESEIGGPRLTEQWGANTSAELVFCGYP
ncbi:overexpressed in colon carcinoma 1 protein [Arapaima gigas]